MGSDLSLVTDSRELPSNLKAEQALLGAILSNNRAYDLCPGLEPEHFGYEVNAEIFRAIKLRIVKGRSVDAVTLWPALQFTGLLNDVGGVAYLTSLLTAMVGISNAGDYAREIRDCASQRSQIEAGRELIEKAYRSKLEDGDASATAAWGISAIEDAARLAGGAEKATMASAVRQAMEQSERAQAGDKSAMGLYTGIITLDNMWGGLYPGSLEIIGAR
ncbi:MAG TPA: DnaB-like helicase N-terminal domain-containing protein, partial [Bryobacteraceae bacterium]